ncbi:MAG: hypothetical protein WDO13_02895 [Verrucomicrobiota bacterium]
MIFILGAGLGGRAWAQDAPAGDAVHGKVLFQQSCAICHSDTSGPGNTQIVKQGPGLVAVLGRHAGVHAQLQLFGVDEP